MPALRMAPPVSLDGMEDRTAVPQVEPVDELALPKPKAPLAPPSPGQPAPIPPPVGAAQSVAPPQTTADPLAFATPGAPIVPPATRIAPPDGPANTTPTAVVPPITMAPPPASPAPVQAPPTGFASIDDYIRATGGDVNASAATKNFSAATGPDALTRANDANAATNRATAQNDARTQMEGIAAAGGVFSDRIPAGTTYGGQADLPTTQSWLDEYLKNAGYDPSVSTSGGAITPPPNGGSGGQRTPGGTGSTSLAEDALNAISPPEPASPQAGLQPFGPTWAPPGARPSVPSGPASGTTPSTPAGAGSLPPVSGGDSVTAGTPAGAAANQVPYVANDIDPDDSLLGKEIQAGPTADRMKIAQDAWENYRKSTDRGFQADSETIAAQSFGRGRGVSGMNRTRLGNLALARQNELDTKGVDFLNAATTGSIDDAFRKVGIAERQQSYQKSLYDTAFNQEKERSLLEDQLTNSAFDRAARQQSAGYRDGPEEIGLMLAKITADQSSAAARAMAEAMKAAGQASGGNFDPIAWAKKYFAEHPEAVTEARRGDYVDDNGGDGSVNV